VLVDVDSDTLYHLGARRLDDAKPTFHLFGADARDGCKVAPNVGTWLMAKPDKAPFRVIPFLEDMDDRGRGQLRFTTLDCKVQDMTIEDAGRPYPRTYEDGFLVPTKDGYILADPWGETTREIAGTLQSVLLWSNTELLWADDQLKSFSEQLEPGSAWGNQVQSVVPIPGASSKLTYLVEDQEGLHHVQFDPESLQFSTRDVLPGACHLQRSSRISGYDNSVWVVVASPCDDPRPSAIQVDLESFEVRDSFRLPFDADARNSRAAVMRDAVGETENEWRVMLYLTDPDESGFGELWAWQEGTESPLDVGGGADLDTAVLSLPGSDWDGAANVNHRQVAGYWASDRITFLWDGTIRERAHAVVEDANGELLVDFDGISGNVANFADRDYDVRFERVPPAYPPAVSYIGDRHLARVDHFDGTGGRLRLGRDVDEPDAWLTVGKNVAPETVRFAWFMPALMFIENWDPDTSSGSLVAYNYELDARTTIAEGVSSFDLTRYPWDSVVYAVPRGKKQGIWVAKAK